MNLFPIKEGSSGDAVKDIQERLAKIEYLSTSKITSHFDANTKQAIEKFCKDCNIEIRDFVDEEVWGELVDATYTLGDRTLYLRMPNFHGSDCKQLQQILGTLGFSVGDEDGRFGVLTESALRQFQLNMGLPSDGIVGAYTYRSIQSLQHSWQGKTAHKDRRVLGLSRVADVLEKNAVCLFGTCDFTRSVANRMSNLALATTPASKVVSAENLSVAPDERMLLFEIALPNSDDKIEGEAHVFYSDDENLLQSDLEKAFVNLKNSSNNRIRVLLPNKSWEEAKEERSAQHYAINLLDALCTSLSTNVIT